MTDYYLLIQVAYIAGFLFLAIIAYIYLQKINIPYTIGLVVIGILVGYLARNTNCTNALQNFRLTPGIILYLIVPALIFSAALGMNLERFFSRISPILILSIPGLIFRALLTGYLVGIFTPLSIGYAMIFGALISATDPVAVVAIFKEQKAPEDLETLVDGESLVNDGTSMVMFSVVCTIILSQKSIVLGTLSAAVVQFLVIFFGGIATGVITTIVLYYLTFHGRNNPTVQIAVSLLIAYISFIVADRIGVSGVMSTVAAAIAYRYLYNNKKDPDAKMQILYFWDFATFIANTTIFLFLGLSEAFLFEKFDLYKDSLFYLALVIVIVLIARFFVVFGSSLVNNIFSKNKITIANQLVMHWGGLRGALPLAMALSLTNANVGEENRQIIILFTLVIILFTLVVQGITIKPLMKRLKLI